MHMVRIRADSVPRAALETEEAKKARPRGRLGAIREVVEEHRHRGLEQGDLRPRLMSAEARGDAGSFPIPSPQRMVGVAERAVGARDLVAERLVVERVTAFDIDRLIARQVVEEPGADSSKTTIQPRQVFVNGQPARAMMELVRVEPQPPKMVAPFARGDIVHDRLHLSKPLAIVVTLRRKRTSERRTRRQRPLDRRVVAPVIDEINAFTPLAQAIRHCGSHHVLVAPCSEDREQSNILELDGVGRVGLSLHPVVWKAKSSAGRVRRVCVPSGEKPEKRRRAHLRDRRGSGPMRKLAQQLVVDRDPEAPLRDVEAQSKSRQEVASERIAVDDDLSAPAIAEPGVEDDDAVVRPRIEMENDLPFGV